MSSYDHHFKAKGGTSLGKWKDRREEESLLREVLGLCANPAIVEVGPGYGYFVRASLDRGLSIQVVEPNEQQARALESLGVEVSRSRGSPHALSRRSL